MSIRELQSLDFQTLTVDEAIALQVLDLAVRGDDAASKFVIDSVDGPSEASPPAAAHPTYIMQYVRSPFSSPSDPDPL